MKSRICNNDLLNDDDNGNDKVENDAEGQTSNCGCN